MLLPSLPVATPAPHPITKTATCCQGSGIAQDTAWVLVEWGLGKWADVTCVEESAGLGSRVKTRSLCLFGTYFHYGENGGGVDKESFRRFLLTLTWGFPGCSWRKTRPELQKRGGILKTCDQLQSCCYLLGQVGGDNSQGPLALEVSGKRLEIT